MPKIFTFTSSENVLKFEPGDLTNYFIHPDTQKNIQEINYVNRIQTTPDRRHLLINCNSSHILVIDRPTMTSVGMLYKAEGRIRDFGLHAESELMFVVGGSARKVFILEKFPETVYRFKKAQTLLDSSRNSQFNVGGEFSVISMAEVNDRVFFTCFDAGLLAVASFQKDLVQFQVLFCFKGFCSDLVGSLTCNRPGYLVYGNISKSASYSHHKDLRKNKTTVICTFGKRLNCSTLSEKLRYLFTSGTDVNLTHLNLSSNKSVKKLIIAGSHNLYATALVNGNRDLIIGTSKGCIYRYKITGRSVTQLIDQNATNKINVFCMYYDKVDEKLYISGYKVNNNKPNMIILDKNEQKVNI